MLMAALNEEVDAYLGRSRYQREEAFRVDWSGFLRQQHDRTRKALAMLAEGHKQVEVADRLGVTPAAVCLWVGKAEREWESFQGEI